MNGIQAEEWLHSLPRVSRMKGVESEKILLGLLGNPEKKLKFVHIAGTNGKGSTATMISNILIAAGYRVGTTISPFILDFRERFQINGEMISPEELQTVTQRVQQASKEMQQTYQQLPCEFVAVTAVALEWFAQKQCDIVVLETGIGGLLDATNAVENTEVACIMRIGFDHTNLLGYTLPEIAKQKCGILKKGCSVVCYPCQPQQALQQIVADCIAKQCSLTLPELEDLRSHKNKGLENKFCYGGYEVDLALLGKHQQYNAMVAIEAVLALWKKGWNISDEAILEGLNHTKFPARIEVLQAKPLIILDGCHNEDGAEALAQTLQQAKLTNLAAIVGVMEDKDCTAMLQELQDCFLHIYTVSPEIPRAMDTEKLAKLAKSFFKNVTVCDTVQDALELVQEDGWEGCVIFGSLYLASQARNKIIQQQN